MKLNRIIRNTGIWASWGLFISASASAADLWAVIKSDLYAAKSEKEVQKYLLQVEEMESLLKQAGAETSQELSVPLPDGQLITFALKYDSILSPELQQQYPELLTYTGIEVDNPQHTGRFDFTPQGFHGMFRYKDKTVYIDPITDQRGQYKVYYAGSNTIRKGGIHDDVIPNYNLPKPYSAQAARLSAKGTTQQRTYRLIISATGEYTAFHGGTESKARAAIATAINRVNQVYQTDLAIRLKLVNFLIYTNASTDPFTNSDSSADITANQNTLISKFGTDAFDIGHLLTTGGGGLAALGGVCDPNQKGEGLTGSDNPTGDSFYIDYVAHEMGHQFGADHTFNGTQGSCAGDNRNNPTAVEPGSASTIMGYAGICENDNLQIGSDAYFHAASISEIQNFVSSASCGTTQTLSNHIPDVDAGKDYTIPANTPFKLTGSATDADSTDRLTYVWEQMDAGTGNSNLSYDDGNGPLFRSWSPTSTGERYLPRLNDLITGKLSKGETWATTSRQLNFRLTVRDGKGGVSKDDTKITVTDNAGPFKVIYPTQKVPVAYNTQVEWNTARTEQAPVNCSTVDILFSSDNGASFSQTLLTGTNNDGKQQVSFPAADVDNARLMIKCSDNIFYALSEKFSVSKSGSDNSSDTNNSSGTDNNNNTSNGSDTGNSNGTNGNGSTTTLQSASSGGSTSFIWLCLLAVPCLMRRGKNE